MHTNQATNIHQNAPPPPTLCKVLCFTWRRYSGTHLCLICVGIVTWILMCSSSIFFILVVILFPEECNMIHSIHTTFQQFHKCIPLVVARETLWLIELTTAFVYLYQSSGSSLFRAVASACLASGHLSKLCLLFGPLRRNLLWCEAPCNGRIKKLPLQSLFVAFVQFCTKGSSINIFCPCPWRNFRESEETSVCHFTHWIWVQHVCITKQGRYWFRQWLVTCYMPSHYLNQCRIL